MKYTINGSAGQRQVTFACPRCRASLKSPLEEAGEVYPCPTCGSEFTTPGVDELRHERRVAVRLSDLEAKERTLGSRSTAARIEAGDLPGHIGQIIAATPLILLSFIFGLLWPVGTVFVLLACRRLLDALDIHGRERLRWLGGCGVPFVGLIVLRNLVDRAAREVDEHRPARSPLTDSEEAEYRRIVRVGRAGMSLAGGVSLLGKVASATVAPVLLAPLVFVGVGVGVWSAAKRRPHVRKLRDHGYVKLWFATSNPIGEYDRTLAK